MRPRLNDMQEYLAREFVDDYHEGHMSRRDMIKRLLGITGGVATTATLLLTLGCAPQPAAATPTSAPAANTPTPAGAAATPTTAAATATTAAATPTTAAAATPTMAAATPSPAASPAAAGTPAAGGATPSPAASPAAAGTPAARAALSVPADDPSLRASDVTYSAGGTTYMAYLAQPNGTGPYPAVLVCHENRGLTDHIRDVTRRLAKAGYVGLALDLLSREGGTDAVEASRVPGLLSADPARAVADFQAAFNHLGTLQFVSGDKVGMVGFCFGGGITWRAATAISGLKAAVPYYGPNPPIEDVPKINAAVLAIYGEQDTRINAGIPAIEEAMKANGKTFEKVIYPGAGHAFNNDTGQAYNEQSAVDAWSKALDWFRRYLA